MMTHDELKSLLRYDPETGKFYWIKSRVACRSGDQCGSYSKALGYNLVGFKYKSYRANRLAFFYMTGRWPAGHVDHINGDSSDDRWCNLRECTPQQNAYNSRPRGAVKGISWDTAREKWLAQARIGGVKKNLGRFDCFGKAVQRHRIARKAAHGEFYRAI